MAVNNNTILSAMYLKGTNDYQQRMPDPTQYTLAQQAQQIFAPNNTRLYNMFVDALINRVGRVFLSQNKEWENPLAVFNKGNMVGFSAEEVALKFIKAHSYEDDKQTLLKLHRPEARTCFHSVDFQQYYPISVNRAELEMAFLNADTGLQEFVNGLFTQQLNSAHYDVYRATLELIAHAEREWGLHKEQVTAIASKATAQDFLVKVKAITGKLKFPSCIYNAENVTDIPVFSRPSECTILTTPDTKAYIDVMAFAELFNMNKAEVEQRIIEVDEFPIPNVVAILCDDSFFQIRDKIFDTTTFYNPETLTETSFLHVWKSISVSPFSNCVVFTTAAGTTTNVIEMVPSSIDLTCDAANNTIAAGGTTQLKIAMAGTVTENDEGVVLAPNAATFELTCAKKLNSRTYVDDQGVLHTQKSGLETGDVIVVKATSTYVNPSGVTTTMQDTLSISIDNTPEVKFTAFKLPVGSGGDLVNGTIDDEAGTIAVDAVAGTAVTALAATFTVPTGDKVYVGSAEQTSGTTANDYTDPVTMRVTDASGTFVKDYVVTVTVAE